MNSKYNNFKKIFILTPDKNAIKKYKKYAVIKLPFLNIPTNFDNNIHNNIYYANFSNNNIKNIIEYIVVKENITHFHLYQSDIISIYFTQIANKFNVKTLYSWHTDIFKTIESNTGKNDIIKKNIL